MNGPRTWHAGFSAAVRPWPTILCMRIFHVLFRHKKVTLKGMALQHCIYFSFVCLCVGWKEIYKGRGTGNAIKSLAFTRDVLRTKNLTRLGASEVPADTHKHARTHLSLEPLRGPLLYFLSHSACGIRDFIPVFFCKALCVRYAIKSVCEAWLKNGDADKGCRQTFELSNVTGLQQMTELSAPWLGDAGAVCILEIKWVKDIAPWQSFSSYDDTCQKRVFFLFFFYPAMRWHPYKLPQGTNELEYI